MAAERLDKLIALHCNLSRRDARKLIKDGAVSVNGTPALRAETAVDTDSDELSVKGQAFTIKKHLYLMLNKPAGVISATNDPKKQTVIDLIPDSLRRRSLFPVGRLDRDTTGLLIITDNGDFAHRVLSPSHHVFKTYIATLRSPLSEQDVAALEAGITLDGDEKCLPAKVRAFTDSDENPCAEIRIREGKYHQVKRMAAAVGNKVEKLERIAVGALSLDTTLERGECRELSAQELEKVFCDPE